MNRLRYTDLRRHHDRENLRMGRHARWGLSLLAALFLAACAATPIVQEQRAQSANTSGYSYVHVVVDAPEHIRQMSGYAETSAELLEEFVANVRASGKYASVGTAITNEKTLEARLTIKELKYVHGAGRFMGGIIAGRAVLRVDMTVKDPQSDTVLALVTANHASHLGQGVFSPTTSRQVSAIAKELSAKLSDM
jgi:hypothetical protein